MPRLTNRHNLPEPIVRAVMRDPYSKGGAHFSISELVDSPRIRALRQAHDHEIEEDVSDMIFSLFGQAMHHVLERGAREGEGSEERLHTTVGGYRISGAMDLQTYSDEHWVVITDYKVTTVASFQREKPQWEQQLNGYAFLARRNGTENIKGLKVVAFLRDWTSGRAADPSYPQAPIQTMDIALWPAADADRYFADCVAEHARAHSAYFSGGISSVVKCSSEERWLSDPVYAVVKIGGKRAKALFESVEGASEHILSLDPKVRDKYEIVVRGGEPKRCAGNWCRVAQWCDQYRKEEETHDDGE